MTSLRTLTKHVMSGLVLVALSLVLALAGCDEVRKEKVLDVEAPGVDIEINKVEGEDGSAEIDIEAGSTAK